MYLNWGVRRHRWIVPPALLVGCSFQFTLQHVWANFWGVILQLYWFSTALISWWRFKLLKALSRITLNLGQKKTGGILSDSKDVMITMRYRVSSFPSVQCNTGCIFPWIPWKQQPQRWRTVPYSRFQNAVYYKAGIHFKAVSSWHSKCSWRHFTSYWCPWTTWQSLPVVDSQNTICTQFLDNTEIPSPATS